ncbi:xanthine dehydrogenase family protein molybdopterin-binding subunit, partial [Paraburkholderia xenovorans]|uniref:xanthine dehydrogenase family protein molybdopterin-binding subunit n=1 Tax=Paraburkholderia xenovorans TaxID=36873 RepID=UPI001558592F
HELTGGGMAGGAWGAMQNEAAGRAVMPGEGGVKVSSSTADIGTGTYTAMSQIAADALGVSIHDVTFELGDTRLPKAPIEGGSWTVSSVGSAVDVVCKRLHNRLVDLALQYGGERFTTAARDSIRRSGDRLICGTSADDAISIDELFNRAGIDKLDEQASVKPHEKQQAYSMGTHSAVFAEVRVDETLGTVRVTRVVSAIAAGRIVNPKTAANQIAGGVVWGISMALHEHGQFDHALGRQMNHNFSEYHVPVNADIHDIDVLFVDEHDDIVNPLGAKGVGEIGVVGVAAAVSNAVWHATGKRVRALPITLDKLLG